MDLAGLGALAGVTVEWLALGWLSRVSFPGQPPAVSWALRLLVGAVLVAAAQLVQSLVGAGFASTPVVLVAAAIGSGALRMAAQSDEACVPEKRVPAWPRERVGWLLLGAVLAAAVVRSLVVPEAGWDAYSHWGLRAQAFALAGTIVNAHSEHEYYPPLVPVLERWLYLHRGAVSIDLAKTLWAVVGTAFAICLAWHLSLALRVRWLAPYFALGIVTATTMLLEGFWTGQADLALTAFLTLAALAAWQWQRDQNRSWLVQAAVFAAAAALCKFEGLPRIGVVVAAFTVEAALARRRAWLLPAVVLAVAAVGASIAWTLVALNLGIQINGEHVGPLQPLALGGVLLGLVATFGGFRTGGGLAVAALAWIVAGRRLLMQPLRPLTLLVLGQAAATLIAFMLSATSPELEVRTSATRLVEHWLPLGLFVAAVGLSEVHL